LGAGFGCDFGLGCVFGFGFGCGFGFDCDFDLGLGSEAGFDCGCGFEEGVDFEAVLELDLRIFALELVSPTADLLDLAEDLRGLSTEAELLSSDFTLSLNT
jgi:hypothetical protein